MTSNQNTPITTHGDPYIIHGTDMYTRVSYPVIIHRSALDYYNSLLGENNVNVPVNNTAPGVPQSTDNVKIPVNNTAPVVPQSKVGAENKEVVLNPEFKRTATSDRGTVKDTKTVEKINSIDWNSENPFIQESILLEINKCIEVASHSKGKVFGGYVRDVLVPRENKYRGHVTFKDVDLWFTDRKSADTFITSMGHILTIIPESVVISAPQYPFPRTQYNLVIHNTKIAVIDVIISKDIPVDDFNVNKLAYFYDNGVLQSLSYGPEHVQVLKGDIISKQLTVLESYQKKIHTSPVHIRDYFLKRMYKYQTNGWTIKYSIKEDGTKMVANGHNPKQNDIADLKSQVADLQRTVNLLLDALKEK